jgi:bacterioferritin
MSPRRKRARQNVDDGADGDVRRQSHGRQALNDSLATEIVCVLRYRRHYFMARGPRRAWRRFRKHSNQGRRTPTRLPSASCNSVASPTSSRHLSARSHAEYVEGRLCAT